MTFPKISTPAQEGVMQVSKSLKHQVLLDSCEMEALMTDLGQFSIFAVSEVVTPETGMISHQQFFDAYNSYVETLKKGEIPGNETRRFFSAVFTVNPDAVYAQEVGNNRYLLKTIRPVVQLQNHAFYIGEEENRVHPTVFSKASVSWGIQFSYPQVAQDPKTLDFVKATDRQIFSNAQLYAELVKWLRHHTRPTSFSRKGVQFVSPIRIGKRSLWAVHHPQLQSKGLELCGLN